MLAFEVESKKKQTNSEVERRLRELETKVQQVEDQDARISTIDFKYVLVEMMDNAEIRKPTQALFWSSLMRKSNLVLPLDEESGYLSDKLLEIGRMELARTSDDEVLLERLVKSLNVYGLRDNNKPCKLCLIKALAEVVKKYGGVKSSKPKLRE